MTTPNQPYPEWMQILGLGAFQIGGSNGSESSFGQSITTDSINQLIAGPIGALATTSSGKGDGTLGDWVDSIADGFKGFLLSLPLQGLQMFQYFLPGTTAADFKDVPTAVDTIMEKFGLDTLLEIGADLDAFQEWLTETWTDFSAAVTAFWTFLNACSAAILHYSTWSQLMIDLNNAWQTFISTLEALALDEWASLEQMLNTIFGIDPASGLNNSWVTLFLQLENLVTLILEGDVSTSDWAAWWITTLEALGYSSTSATSIGNWLSGNYAAAINAKAWVSRLLTDLTIVCDFLHVVYQAGAASDSTTHLGTNGKRTWWSAINDILALFGLANGGIAPSLTGSTPGQAISTAGTNASTGITWVTRLLTDLTIVFDLLHVVYQAGAATDAVTHTGTNGKRTWWSAVNDILALFGVAAGTSAASLSGSTIGQTVGAASTNATNSVGWITRLVNDLIVTSDVFHLTYPVGTAGDVPGTKIGGKPTWYSCWNDMLQLLGLVNSTSTPALAATDVGGAINAAQSSADGAAGSAQTALNQLTNIPAQTVVPNTNNGHSAVTFDHAGSGGSVTGANGSVTPSLNTAGTQTVGATAAVMIGVASYSIAGSGLGSVYCQLTCGGMAMQSLGFVQIPFVEQFLEFFILWNPPVGTNKVVTAQAWGANGAGISNLSFESATYIGATSVSPSLSTSTGTGTTLSVTASSAVVGTMAVGAFTAGNSTTKALTTLSGLTTQRDNVTNPINSGQAGYQSLALGDRTGVAFGVTFTASAANSASWAGASIVLGSQAVIGSGFRAVNTSASAVAAVAGTHLLPSTFFNSVTAQSTDDYGTITGNSVKVTVAGWYKIKIGLLTHTYSTFLLGPALFINSSLVELGHYVAPTSGAILTDTFLWYCNAGDVIGAGYSAATSYSDTFIGDPAGQACYFTIAIQNRSLL